MFHMFKNIYNILTYFHLSSVYLELFCCSNILIIFCTFYNGKVYNFILGLGRYIIFLFQQFDQINNNVM